MAQNREKEETLDLQVPTESPLSLPSCSDTCKLNKKRPGSDLTRLDPAFLDKAECRSRSEKLSQTEELPQISASGEAELTTRPAKKAVNRCSGCAKRVGLTGFRCRCGYLFCSEHRYSDRHDCSFDYKTAGRESIARENPVIRAAKILKV